MVKIMNKQRLTTKRYYYYWEKPRFNISTFNFVINITTLWILFSIDLFQASEETNGDTLNLYLKTIITPSVTALNESTYIGLEKLLLNMLKAERWLEQFDNKTKCWYSLPTEPVTTGVFRHSFTNMTILSYGKWRHVKHSPL